MANPSLIIGNGKWAVKEDKLLGYKKTIGGNYIPKEGDFSRAGDGTIVNKDGLIENVPYNLLSYSEEFDNAVWPSVNCTITESSVVSPNINGITKTAYLFTIDAIVNTYIRPNIFTVIDNCTFSIFVKKGSQSLLQFYDGADGQVYVNFDIENGIIGTYGTNTIPFIEDVGGGWFRAGYQNIGAIQYPRVSPSTSISSGYGAGNNFTVNNNFYIYGAQLVQGTEPKPYFKTEDRLNIPRIDFSDNPDGALSLEPQSTNVIPYSEDFSAAGWYSAGATMTPNTAISPDGLMNATLYSRTSTTWASFAKFGGVNTTSGDWIQSIYVKYVDIQYFGIIASQGSNDVIIDLISKTVVSDTSGLFHSIELLGNGWMRISVKTIALAAYQSLYIHLSSVNSDLIAPSALGSCYIWGAQVEEGSHPTSYIPTNGATVTRLADKPTDFGTVNDFNSE